MRRTCGPLLFVLLLMLLVGSLAPLRTGAVQEDAAEELFDLRDLHDWKELASRFDLNGAHAVELRNDLLSGTREYQKRLEHYHRAGLDILPFLISIADDPSLLEEPSGRHVSRPVVYSWLAASDDPRAEEFFLNTAAEALCAPVASIEQVDKIPLIELSATRRGQELLLELQGKEFWHKRRMHFAESEESRGDVPNLVATVQDRAVDTLAASGSTFAIKVFGTGKGVNARFKERLDELFEWAVREHAGVSGVPEWYGQDLPEDALAEINRIFAEYGRTYTPKEKKNLRISDPHP